MERFIQTLLASSLTALVAGLLTGCGSSSHGAPDAPWQKGVYQSPDVFMNYCEIPRKGVNQYTQQAYPDKLGTRTHEKHFLRAWSHRDYLWYDELDDIDPNNNQSTTDYFGLLKTEGKTANGTPKDKFHSYNNEESGDQLVYTGETGGFGVRWASNDHINFYVSLVEHNSPAALAGITRGMLLRKVDNASFPLPDNEEEKRISILKINEFLGAPILNQTYAATFEKNGVSSSFNITAKNVEIASVHANDVIELNGQKIGYLMFNTFEILKGETELREAFNDFAKLGINELVLDLRYNGGGFLHIAAQLGYQIAGNASKDKTFSKLLYNDKRSANNVVIPFISTTENNSQPLSSLNLNRVYVITTGNTCSASEAVMNGLRGVGVEVIQIGSTTCGKPHGFNAATNCGIRYYSIDFEYTNDQGFSDFGDGFEPVATGGNVLSNKINGCSVSDDIDHELGDSNETMLKTALYHQQNGSCPAAATAIAKGQQKTSATPSELKLLRPQSQEILLFKDDWK